MDAKQKEQFAELISPGWFEYFESISSTNDVARQWQKEGAPDFSIAAANEQTKGRGRNDRQWFTPPNSALAFSLLLTDDLEVDSLPFYTGLGAVAVCRAIEDFSNVRAEIKWPNDVLLEKNKAAGILVEGSWSGDALEGVVVGIGVNVTAESVPPDEELLFPANFVDNVTEDQVDRFELLEKVLIHLKRIRENMDLRQLVEEWDDRLAFKGEKVYVQRLNGEQTSGVLVGLNDRGELVIELENGKRESFSSNEIHLRPFSFL